MPTPPPGTPTLDLTLPGTAGSINGAVFMTGVYGLDPDLFSSFLEIRHNGVEQGYNTDGALQQDQRDVQNSTHSILLAEVPIVIGDGSQGTQEGVAYREFRLNLGEAGNAKQYLSLDALQIWQEESGNLTNFTAGSGFAGTHTNYLAYNLDASANVWIGLKEGLNGNGANTTEYTVLVPDAFFVNDPSHRYVTLYSKFGEQAGWDADSSSEEWGLSHPSGGPVSAMTVHKTATVPGGTANAVGEVISYDITVANVGNTNLTGITASDPSVGNLAAVTSGGFNVGDTNHDNQLSTGETWQYTASHAVTQDDLDTNGGGDGFIENTVTVDSNETTPVSASSSVTVEQSAHATLHKTGVVADGTANAAGDVINYTITVTNDGLVTLTNPLVVDSTINILTPNLDPFAPILGSQTVLSPVYNGDYNVGDTNQNGIQDPGETFQYQIAGDDNNNGIEDPGETFVFANVGDTNRNGIQDPGETFQFYNAGDTNHNGVEDSGETFQFSVNNSPNPVDANNDGFNDGDTNHDGQINVGETWQYGFQYTLTQADIDNRNGGGVPTVNPGLTRDNTATVTTSQGASSTDTVLIPVVQNPDFTVTKTADVASVDSAGDVIHYTVAVHNSGNMTLTGLTVSDPMVANLAYASGDTNSDGELDLGETWSYTGSYTVQQSDIDNGGVVNPALTRTNTATADTAQTAPKTASASVGIVQNPDFSVTKTADVASVDSAGDVIHYTVAVHNTGNMTLTGLSVTDPMVANLAYASGDTNSDGKLDLTETWNYTGSYTVQQSDIDNGGVVDPALTRTNTATADTAQTAPKTASASVGIVQTPDLTITKTADVASVSAAGDVIHYSVVVDNTGNMTLTGVAVTDTLTTLTLASGDTNSDGKLDINETWTYTGSYTAQAADFDGSIDNTATVDTAQTAPESASASVTATPPATVGVSIDDINHLSQLVDPGGDGPSVGDLIQFFFQITNLGNTTLTNVAVSDTLGDAVAGSLQTPVPTTLAGNATFGDTFNHHITAADLSAHHVIDDITVTALDYLSAPQTATWHYDFVL